MSNKIDFDELWDECSEYIDDDLFSLERVAGSSVITKSGWLKLIKKLSSPTPIQEPWVSVKPEFKEDCILITATWIGGRINHWLYMQFEINKTDSDEGWYWGIFQEGDEWGDIADLKADLYLSIPTLQPPQTINQ